MKLYYTPGACSMAPHIVLQEAGYDFSIERVDLKAKVTETGADFRAINPKGYIPALVLDNGDVITEGVVISTYLADQRPELKLAPQPGTMERVRLDEWMVFIATELHKGFSPLYQSTNPETVEAAKTRLFLRYDYLDSHLAGKQFLLGDSFTVADAYAFTVLNWAPGKGIDLAKWPNISAYHARLAARASVKEAMEAEGLLQKAAA